MKKLYSLMNNIEIKDNVFTKKLKISDHKYLNPSLIKMYLDKINLYDNLYISSSIDNDYLLSKYHFSNQLININVVDNKTLVKIVSELKKIHKIPVNNKNNNYLKNINDWFVKNLKTNIYDFAQYKNIINNLEINYDDIVLCHNDLHLQNIKFIDTKVKIIDWDFIGTNDYHYDIASLCGELNLSDKEIKLVCRSYSKKINIKKVYKYIFIEKIINGSWALYWYIKKNDAQYYNIFLDKKQYLEKHKTTFF